MSSGMIMFMWVGSARSCPSFSWISRSLAGLRLRKVSMLRLSFFRLQVWQEARRLSYRSGPPWDLGICVVQFQAFVFPFPVAVDAPVLVPESYRGPEVCLVQGSLLVLCPLGSPGLSEDLGVEGGGLYVDILYGEHAVLRRPHPGQGVLQSGADAGREPAVGPGPIVGTGVSGTGSCGSGGSGGVLPALDEALGDVLALVLDFDADQGGP